MGPCPSCLGESVVVIGLVMESSGGIFDLRDTFVCTRCDWRVPAPSCPIQWRQSAAIQMETLRILRRCSMALTPARKLRRLETIRACQRSLVLLRIQRRQVRAVAR